MTATPTDTRTIRTTLDALFTPGDVVELRILNTRRGTVSGYYAGMEALARDAAQWSGKVPAIYVTLNPFNPDLLARSANRLTQYAKHTTTGKDIPRRRWLPIDVDPVRPAGISATDAQHEAALERAGACRERQLAPALAGTDPGRLWQRRPSPLSHCPPQ